MDTLFHVTVRNEQDETIEFDSAQPVVHIDLPAGRYFITVRCAQHDPQPRAPAASIH